MTQYNVVKVHAWEADEILETFDNETDARNRAADHNCMTDLSLVSYRVVPVDTAPNIVRCDNCGHIIDHTGPNCWACGAEYGDKMAKRCNNCKRGLVYYDNTSGVCDACEVACSMCGVITATGEALCQQHKSERWTDDDIRPDADGNIYPETVVCSYCHNETCGTDCEQYQAPTAYVDSKNKTVTVYGSTGNEIVYNDIVSFTEIENIIKKHVIHWNDVTWKISQVQYRFYKQFLHNYTFKRFCYYCDTNNNVFVGDECHNCFYNDCVKLLADLGTSPQ